MCAKSRCADIDSALISMFDIQAGAYSYARSSFKQQGSSNFFLANALSSTMSMQTPAVPLLPFTFTP